MSLEAAQSSCRYPIPGNVKAPSNLALVQPSLVKGAPAQGRGVETR